MDFLPVIAIHGGAWAIPDSLAQASIDGVKEAALEAYKLLKEGLSATDAVEHAVFKLENNPAFDAGTGSVLNSDEEVEMDAMIMDGSSLKCGAVACVQNIANPVKLAKLVMEKTEHLLLVGKGANAFAEEMGIKPVLADQLVTQAAREELERFKKYNVTILNEFSVRDLVPGHETVGAVAIDVKGNIACATSTGGITAKRPGRVGDSPIIGCGGYADSSVGGVSCTGHGEAISRVCLAHRIISSMENGAGASAAAEKSLHFMQQRIQGAGGVIVVSRTGEATAEFNTERMAWAIAKNNVLTCGLNPKEIFTEPLESLDK